MNLTLFGPDESMIVIVASFVTIEEGLEFLTEPAIVRPNLC